MNRKLESGLVGVTGEYFVAAELSARGHIASITLRNSRGIDILASSADGTKSISIQVKTNSGGKPVWLLNKKAESYYAENHFYVFVTLHSLGTRPDFHIVPSNVVAGFVASHHKQWLSGAKRDGSERQDTSMRKFIDTAAEYKEKWGLLGL